MAEQGGGIPLQSVLKAATVVKILTEKIYNGIAYICEILLDLDQLDHVYQRDSVA